MWQLWFLLQNALRSAEKRAFVGSFDHREVVIGIPAAKTVKPILCNAFTALYLPSLCRNLYPVIVPEESTIRSLQNMVGHPSVRTKGERTH